MLGMWFTTGQHGEKLRTMVDCWLYRPSPKIYNSFQKGWSWLTIVDNDGWHWWLMLILLDVDGIRHPRKLSGTCGWMWAWIHGKHHPEWAMAWAPWYRPSDGGRRCSLGALCGAATPMISGIAGDVQKKKGFWKDGEMENSSFTHS